MATSPKKYKGSCLCGEVSFSFTTPLDDVWFCHCTQCRKNYGTYGTFVGIPRESFSLKTKKKLHAYQSSANTKRSFCGTCGSPITWDRKGYDRIYILAGLIDGSAKVQKGQHIFVKDKGEYYQICDSFPQFKTTPP